MYNLLAFLRRTRFRKCGTCGEVDLKGNMRHPGLGAWFCNAPCEDADALDARSW